MDNTDNHWLKAIAAATSVGNKIVSTIEEFNRGCDHIVQLINDASVLLEHKSHATSAFLAISALEEISKLQIGVFRSGAKQVPRGKDPLYKHDQKHLLTMGPTVAMGSRLKSAIGESRMNELMKLAHDGKLVRIRESALYLERINGQLVDPISAVSARTACELLLLAIEAFDDGLVGNTNHTYTCAEKTDELFKKWATNLPGA